MKNRFKKSRCRIVPDKELESDSVLKDIKDIRFEDEIYIDKRIKSRLGAWIVLAIVIIIILLYIAAKLRL
jgi:hypothetical protein